MNFHAVVLSGKPCRRPLWKKGYFIQACSNGLIHSSEYFGQPHPPGTPPFREPGPNRIRAEYRFHTDDYLADDWEFFPEEDVPAVYVDAGVTLNGETLYRKK